MGDAIRRHMKDRGISTAELADMLHLSQWAMYKILRDERELRVGEYFEICRILGTEPLEMAGEAGIYK
jgi:transcriptional regulator with XRE-family HTH domain